MIGTAGQGDIFYFRMMTYWGNRCSTGPWSQLTLFREIEAQLDLSEAGCHLREAEATAEWLCHSFMP